MDSMEKLHESLKKSHFRIEKFIQNPGLQHIALAIFKKLDPKSLGNCRVVAKEWKACIDQAEAKDEDGKTPFQLTCPY